MISVPPPPPTPKKTTYQFVILILSVILTISTIYILRRCPLTSPSGFLTPIASNDQPRPLDAYTFEALSLRPIQPSSIVEEEIITSSDTYTSYLISYQSDGKKITGQLNKPSPISTPVPAIIMIRGYVNPDIYQTGVGTKNAAAFFADSGFATFAPDFLGYGGSDMPDADVFAERLIRPIAVLDLIASVKELDYVDPDHIFLWGHSNGGQIALSILQITGEPYPTTLWAPVSKGFPYSILYYTDEYDDYGKALRHELAKFESIYNTDLYSIHNYFDLINAPIQIHQGGADDAIPLEWSRELVEALTTIKNSTTSGEFLDVTYYQYPSADHNLRPDWNTVVQRDLQFFQNHKL